jgi:hypothetical protein
MDKRKRRIVVAIMLMIAIGNFSRLTTNSTIRAVEMFSLLSIGIFVGFLIRDFLDGLIKKKDEV